MRLKARAVFETPLKDLEYEYNKEHELKKKTSEICLG